MGQQSEVRYHEHVNMFQILELAKWLLEHKKEVEEFMSQVQFTVAITVAGSTTPPPAPLAEGAPSGSAQFTVGVQASSILTPITGGVPPYTVNVDPASPSPLPPGIVAGIDPNNNLILSGTATAAGSGSVLLDVVDSAGSTVAQAAFRHVSK